ncbi:hypothetical protein [Actinoallomurus soli]|nr:hypothetical protein [Actinoallomurus soli]
MVQHRAGVHGSVSGLKLFRNTDDDSLLILPTLPTRAKHGTTY